MCFGSSLTGATSPKRPYRVSSLPVVTAVVTNTLFPQTTGLEWANPGISVFQRTLVFFGTSHLTTAGLPSTTPVAPGPRNWGQFCAFTPSTTDNTNKTDSRSLFI